MVLSGGDELEHFTYKKLYYLDSEDIEEYKRIITKTISIRPNDFDLNLSRAKLLAYDGKYIEAKTILNSLLEYSAKIPETYYLLMRIYSIQDSVKQATKYFYTILDMEISENLLAEIRDDCWALFTKEEREDFNNAIDKKIFINNFWKANDPTPATYDNEFISQSFQRMEFALKNFRYRDEIDERGEVYLRYGEPNVRKIFRHYGHETECWIYHELAPTKTFFDFISSFTRNRYNLILDYRDLFGSRFTNYDPFSNDFDSDVEGRSLVKRTQSKPSRFFFEDRAHLDPFYAQIYKYLFSGEMGAYRDVRTGLGRYFSKVNRQRFQIPRTVIESDKYFFKLNFDYARFRGINNTIKLESYYGFPLRIAGQIYKYDEDSTLTLNEYFLLKDTLFTPLGEDKNVIDLETFGKSSSFYENEKVLYVKPNDYVYVVEIEDKNQRFRGSNQVIINTDDFLQDDLFLSDIQLSTEIVTSNWRGQNLKNGLKIEPYPYVYLNKNEPFYIYFEIYNLLTVENISEYELTYTISNDNAQPALASIFGFLSGKDNSISFKQKYNGRSDTDHLYFLLDCRELDPGLTKLTVKVKDLWSGKEFTREKTFTLIDSKFF